MAKKVIYEVVNPFGERFQEAWDLWKRYKKEAHKFTYKSSISEMMAIRLAAKFGSNNEELAIAVIEQSIENQWKGFFALKNNTIPNGQQNKPDSTYSARQSLNDEFNRRFGSGR